VNIDRATTPETVRDHSTKRRPLLKKPNKAEVNEEDVQKQIKETLARLTEKRSGKSGAKYRREKREAFHSVTKKKPFYRNAKAAFSNLPNS